MAYPWSAFLHFYLRADRPLSANVRREWTLRQPFEERETGDARRLPPRAEAPIYPAPLLSVPSLFLIASKTRIFRSPLTP
jgi:hypothetical protein